MPSILITLMLGSQIASFSNQIVLTIIETFKHYPYLLEGEYDYNQQYFKEITTSNHGGLALATLKEEFAGFLMGCPLAARQEQFADAFEIFKKNNFTASDYYLFTDVVVLPKFQNKKIASNLFAYFEEWVKSWGYKGICLFIIQHNEDHALKPVDYKNIDDFYAKLGYTKTEIQSISTWPTIMDAQGTVSFLEHVLYFWIKQF